MAKTFVLSDESLNSYGFWVLTSGINLTQFKKNPIMLWNHNRAWRGTTEEVLPIGKWENVQVENGRLLADAVFDQNDDFAKKIEAKVEAGIINMCSVGLDIVTESEDPAYIKSGQRRRTILKSKLREVSICDIGSNDNALVLYDKTGNIVNLTDGDDCPIQLISTNKNKMRSIALKLGLQEDASEGDILKKVQEMHDESGSRLVLSAETCTKLGIEPTAATAAIVETAVKDLAERAEKAEKTLSDQAEAKCTALVDDAVKAGRITAELKETYLEMARLNFEKAEKALNAIPTKKNFNEKSEKGGYEAGSVWAQRQEEIRKGGGE